MAELHPERSPEEMDQIHRSVKKYKRPAVTEPSSLIDRPWTQPKVWADLVRAPLPANLLPDGELYTGDGEIDDDEEDEGIHLQSQAMFECNDIGPGRVVVDIPVEECKLLWRSCRRALIVKPLGRNVSFRVLSHRLTDMWALSRRIDIIALEDGIDIIDLEDGFYVVRFYSKDDYTHVLEEGPWTIQGHYLTVAKFRPGFLPSARLCLPLWCG